MNCNSATLQIVFLCSSIFLCNLASWWWCRLALGAGKDASTPCRTLKVQTLPEIYSYSPYLVWSTRNIPGAAETFTMDGEKWVVHAVGVKQAFYHY